MGWTILKPRRRTLGALAPEVRRLYFECGRSAEEIAADLGGDVAAIAEELALLVRRQRHTRAAGVARNRPRSRREQAALSEWDRAADDVADAAAGPAFPVAAAPPAATIVAAEPTEWDGPASPNVGRIDGSVVRRGPARKAKGTRRVYRGDRRVKLTEEDREEIRRLAREEGWGCRRLARRFGVDRTTISRLLAGQAWVSEAKAAGRGVAIRESAVPIGLRPAESETAGAAPVRRVPIPDNAKLSPEQREEARELARQGWGCRRLAKKFNVNRETMRRFLLGISYPDDPGAPRRRRPERFEHDPADPMHRDPEPPTELPHQVVIVQPPTVIEDDGPGDGMDDRVEAEWCHWDG